MGVRRKFSSGRLILALFGIAACWSPGALAQGEPPATGTDLTAEMLSVAKELSENSGITLSTALTDLVTQSAPLRASSGLGTITGQGQLPVSSFPLGKAMTDGQMRIQSFGRNSRSEYLDIETAADSPIAEVAMDRGYTPRTVELDSGFDSNVLRAASASVDSPQTQGRIFGGRPIKPGSDPFPEVVAVTGNNKICSGTLVAPDKVFDSRPLLLRRRNAGGSIGAEHFLSVSEDCG